MLKTVIFKFYSMKFLSFVIREEKPADTQVEDDEEEKFVPSLLNSTVYIISMALQVSTFAINYRVSPSFMLLEENGLKEDRSFNPLNPELNPICYLLALLGTHHFLHVSRIRVKLLTFRLLMSYIYGAPILDVSRSHNDAAQSVGLLWTSDQLVAETST